MKKFLYIAIIGMVIWSCGGDGDDPPPPPENQAPSTPTTIYPANNELCIDNAVNFQWNASTDPEGDAITYTIEVSENSAFSSITHTQTTSSTSLSISLNKGISFYWRVTAKDSKDLSSDASSSNGFYTEGEGVSNYAPFSPVLVAPTLGATVTADSVTLMWTADDVDTDDTLTFDVFFATDEEIVKEALKEYYEKIKDNPDFDTDYRIGKDQSGNTLIYNGLEVSTNYYWIVVVKDDKGGQTIGQVWSFKTD